MALSVLEKKAYFIGTWKDDAVTDNIIKQIATLTAVEKGRKVKLKLGPDGLRITKSNIFQMKSLTDFILLPDIFFMTINQRHPMCLLCIIRDPIHKYTILAFRCNSELTAGTFVQNFKALKRSTGQGVNIEFRKKDNGNWTLRERTNANAKRELQQLFQADTSVTNSTPQVNGGIFYKKSDKRNGELKKGNMYDETPYIPTNTRTIHTEVYTEKSIPGQTIHNIGTQAIGRDDDQMSDISDMSSIKGEMEALSAELKEVKYLLERSTGISAQEHYRLASMTRGGGVTNNNESQAINYNKYSEPEVVVHNDNDYHNSINTTVVASTEVPDYRSFGVQTARKSRTLETGPEHLIAQSYRNSTVVSPDPYQRHADIDKRQYKIYSGTNMKHDVVEMRHPRRPEPEYRVARHSGGLEPEVGVVYAAEKEADVGTVMYPQTTLDSSRGSIASTLVSGNSKYRSKSMKLNMGPHQSPFVPTIVERSIENIYSRPVIIRRDYIVGTAPRRQRPHSMYVTRPNGGYIYGSQIISSKEQF